MSTESVRRSEHGKEVSTERADGFLKGKWKKVLGILGITAAVAIGLVTGAYFGAPYVPEDWAISGPLMDFKESIDKGLEAVGGAFGAKPADPFAPKPI